MDFKIKKLEASDSGKLAELIDVFREVFEMQPFSKPEENYLTELLSKNEFIVFVALQNDKVVAGLTAYVLQQYYSVRPLVYIFDLAVTQSLQHKGIGKRLIADLKEYCRELGAEEVFVQADEPDVNALRFYHSTGGLPEKVIHFTYPLLQNKKT